jgi:hypothetical protein
MEKSPAKPFFLEDKPVCKSLEAICLMKEKLLHVQNAVASECIRMAYAILAME